MRLGHTRRRHVDSGGIGELVLQVSVFHTGDRYAEDAFVRDRKKVPATDLDHLGDQAYVTTSLRPVLEPDDGARTSRTVVVVRDDNLVLRVEYVHIPSARIPAATTGRDGVAGDRPTPGETRAATTELVRDVVDRIRAGVD